MTTNETIPAERLAEMAWRDLEIAAASSGRLAAHSITLPIEMVRALVATRPSSEALQRAREDERDRLRARAEREAEIGFDNRQTISFLEAMDCRVPADRAAKRQEAGE